MSTISAIDIYMPTDEEDAALIAAALSDPDNPPLTDEELAGFRPMREMTDPALYAALTDKTHPIKCVPVTDAEDTARQTASGKRGRGRPPLDSPKQCTAIRLDEDLIAHLRASGRGWQTRINAILREAMEAGRL